MITKFRYPLIPHLQNLKGELLSPYDRNSDKHYQSQLELEQLPYCLEAARFAVRELLEHANQLSIKYEDFRKTGSNALVSTQHRDPLAFMVDNFLDAARRAQNAISPYLSRALSKSYPNSLNKLFKGIESGKYSFPNEIHNILHDYWKTHGTKLRHYRDLSQHFRVVSSEAMLKFGPDGKAYLYLVLPNNPEVRNEEMLVWMAPFVHAIPYVFKNFFLLVDVMFNVTKLLLKTPHEQNIPVVEIASMKGLNIPSELIKIPSVELFDRKVEFYRQNETNSTII